MIGSALRVQGISKAFGELSVLRATNLIAPAGRVTAIIGPNGAGKTTLLHAVTGHLRPDAGTVHLGDTLVSGLPPWRIARLGIGKLFQESRAFEHLSAISNVKMALQDRSAETLSAAFFQSASLAARERKMSVEAQLALQLIGIDPPYDRPARDCSVGYRKLIAIARLIAGSFSVLVMDEPTAGLSAEAINHVSDALVKLAGAGKTIVLVEHNLPFVRRVASHAYFMANGTVRDFGSVESVLAAADNRELLLGL